MSLYSIRMSDAVILSQDRLDVHFKLRVIASVAAVRLRDVIIVPDFSIMGLLGVFGGWTCDPWNDGQTFWRSLSYWGATTFQQELAVIDNPSTARSCAEEGPSGGRRVVMGHVRRVADGHPPGRRDGLSSGLLVVSGHLLLDIVN